jgi:hypothetical protein
MSASVLALRDAAIALAGKGMRIFPCLERAKEPAIAKNLERATTDVKWIAGWWDTRNFNIGLATGADSGVWVLDIDGEEGEATLRALEAQHGPLPPTVEAITGKGRHLYWRWPTGRVIRNRQVSTVMPGIDVRGDGGYVLAPPSIHPSGRIYSWSVDSNDCFEDAPEWLVDLVAKDGVHPHVAASPEQWRSFLDTTVDGSRRGAAIARAYGLLVRKYLDPIVAFGFVQLFNESRCQPPLGFAKLEKIATEILHREAEQVRNGP